ncbi:MAG: hypothetical protein AAB341_00245, partial [Planctomycetota bacterium]
RRQPHRPNTKHRIFHCGHWSNTQVDGVFAGLLLALVCLTDPSPDLNFSRPTGPTAPDRED